MKCISNVLCDSRKAKIVFPACQWPSSLLSQGSPGLTKPDKRPFQPTIS